jgi:hypothetical protein
MKLYELPMELEALMLRYETLLSETVGEVTPEVEKLEQEMAEYFAAGQDKVEAAAMVIKNLEADAIAADSESKRLKNRANSIQNNADRLRALTLIAVSALGGKVKTPRFTIWKQQSKNTVVYSISPLVDVTEFAEKYPNFSRVNIELDKTAVKEYAKTGAVIPPEIVAEDHPGTDFLQIR